MGSRRPAIALGLAVMALVACTKSEPPKSVTYYAEHKAERDARLAVCKDNPGELKDDPDCTNAREAVMKAWSSPDMPPIPRASAAAASR